MASVLCPRAAYPPGPQRYVRPFMKHRYWIVFAGIVLLPVILTLAVWLWVLLSPDPLGHPLSAAFPWPVACSTRGCITTTAWHTHMQSRLAFMAKTSQPKPTSAEALQTLIRHHLSAYALVRSPVTMADVRRYREEILNIKDDATVMDATGLSLSDYDEQVILPFLQQEALRQQQKVESIEELYVALARDRAILVLPFALGWDKNKAVVTTNSLHAAKGS